MKIKDIDHTTKSLKESNESESSMGIWYDYDDVDDFIDSVDTGKFVYDITNYLPFNEVIDDRTANDYEDNEMGERTLSWYLPNSGVDLAIQFDFPTFADLIKFANSDYTEEEFTNHVDDVWSTNGNGDGYDDFCSDMDELLDPSDYGYSKDEDYDDDEDEVKEYYEDGLLIRKDTVIKAKTDVKSVNIPDSVTEIADSAFSDCTKLTSISIPNSVKRIGWGAFRNCTKITSIAIPDSVTRIDDAAFKNCESLKNITIPDGVKYICWSTFKDCSSLTSITIPNSITHIDVSSFYNCKNLKNVYFKGSKEDWDSIEIEDENENLTNATTHYNYKGSANESLSETTEINEDKTYIDTHGGFGEPGEKITFKDIKKYWDNNFDTDPCLQEYDSEDEEDVDKKIEKSKSIKESSTLSKLVKSGYTLKEIQKFFKDETGLDMTPENSEEFKKWSARFLKSINESKSIKESLDEDLSIDSSYKDAKQLIEDIDKFLKEIEENGVSAQYFSSDDLDALHKGRDAIFDFTVVYEENGFPDALNQNVEYKLAFKPVNDVVNVNCTNGLISAVKSAGFNFNSARKIAGNYYITIICKPNDLSRAKLAIENCGFFKSWLESNESIKPKFSKLTLVKESGVYRFKSNK